jgi:hypothetical protein
MNKPIRSLATIALLRLGRKMRKALMILSACALFGAVAHAGEMDFIGSSCTPDPDTIGRYTVSAGAISFAPGVTGQITFYCPISSPGALTKPANLWFAFWDGLVATKDNVQVGYWKRSKESNSLSEIAQVSSIQNLGAKGGPGCGASNRWSACNQPISPPDAYQPSQFIYYLRVDLFRTGVNNIETFYGATLWD